MRNLISGRYDNAYAWCLSTTPRSGRGTCPRKSLARSMTAYDADETLTDGTRCFIDRHVTPGSDRQRLGVAWARPDRPQEGVSPDRLLQPALRYCGDRRSDTRTDLEAGAAKFRADRAAREEAEAVVDRWNRRLATGGDML
jgi:hypothetical protein